MTGEDLVKIRIDVPGGDPVKIERVWALPVENGLYELKNSPFYAFDLNWGDVVRVHPLEDDVPVVVEVIRRSDHKTLRIIFASNTSEDARRDVLTQLERMSTNYERGWGVLYALDCRPEAPYQAICDYLFDLEREGVLTYDRGATSTRTLADMETEAEP